ncbi:MAG: hypothetical protein WC341_00420 [Bacteroidales bacterium]
MTGYIGSGSGLADLGMIRVKGITGTTSGSITCAYVSGITWGTSVYITIVDDFGLWAKLPNQDLSLIQMDGGTAYTNQNTYLQPTPILGGDTAIPYASGSCILDATNSYCLDGSAIVSYSWSVKNGLLTAGSIVAPTSGSTAWVFTAPGSYVVNCTITSGSGVATTAHRSYYVYDEGAYKPLDQITAQNISADRDSGGWKADITAWDDAGSNIKDRAKIILLATDIYSGSVSGGIGQMAGSEAVVMVGWINGETIDYDRETSHVKFSIEGANYWLQKCTGPSTFLESTEITSDAWTSIEMMTLDKMIHHFMYWRSTAMEIMDVYRSLNTRIMGGMSASIGSIWEQMNETATTRMLSNLGVDRFGRFFCWLDPQIIPIADRTSIITVQEILTTDLTEQATFKRTVVNPVSLCEVAGLSTPTGDADVVNMFMSRAPGSLIYNRWGDNDQNDRLIVTDQSDANILSGMILAKKNNEYSVAGFKLAENNRMLDIAPAMYVTYTVSPTDTIRGISFTTKKFLISRIDYSIDQNGAVITELTCEGETSGIPGYTVVMPQEPVYNFPEYTDYTIQNLPSLSDYTFPKMPGLFVIDPNIPEPTFLPTSSNMGGSPCRSGTVIPANGPYDVQMPKIVSSTDRWGKVAKFSAFLRPSGSATPSRYEINGLFQKLSMSGSVIDINATALPYVEEPLDDWYVVAAWDTNWNLVANGVPDPVTDPTKRTGTFNNAVGKDITYVTLAPKVWENLSFNLLNPLNENAWKDSVGKTSGLTFTGTGVTAKPHTMKDGAIVLTSFVVGSNPLFGGAYPLRPTYQNRTYFSGSALSSSAVVYVKILLGSPYTSDPYYALSRLGIGYINTGVENLAYPAIGADCYTQEYFKAFKGVFTNKIDWAIGLYDGGPEGEIRTFPFSVYAYMGLIPSHKITVNNFLIYNICANSADG